MTSMASASIATTWCTSATTLTRPMGSRSMSPGNGSTPCQAVCQLVHEPTPQSASVKWPARAALLLVVPAGPSVSGLHPITR